MLEMKRLLKGGSQVISSKLNPNYSLILKVIENGEHNLNDIVDCSLMETDILQQANQTIEQIEKLDIPKEILEEDLSIVKQYNELCQTKIDGFITINKKTLEKNLQKARKLKENPEFTKKWDLWNNWKEKLSTKEQLEKELRNIQGYSSYKIKYYTKVLIENGYISNEDDDISKIKKDNLTKKGIVACHIHEGNPIYISELMELGLLDKLDCYQLIDFLSLFTEPNKNITDFIDILKEFPEWLKQIKEEVDYIKHKFISYFNI
jgi:superfamily II RNA helicase